MSFSELATPSATRSVLERHGVEAKHRLGQNFLVDDDVVGRILELAGLEGEEPASDCAGSLPTLLEIGPGIGTLTVALLRHADVVAVERDPDLVPVLRETTPGHAGRMELVEKDALDVGAEDVERACEKLGAELPRMLVANLPYQIAATVVLDWFSRFEFLDTMVVMVQSEVADRMCATPGTKDYGAYTVKLSLYARPAGRFQVAPGCFMPAPHVTSSVIRLERIPCDDETLRTRACELADASFAMRRKTIRNSLKSRYDATSVDALLSACGVEPTCRGETLAPGEYLRLARAFEDLELG